MLHSFVTQADFMQSTHADCPETDSQFIRRIEVQYIDLFAIESQVFSMQLLLKLLFTSVVLYSATPIWFITH